jgi:hypothetical protein
MVRKVLLICGILASLIYVGSDILAAMLWEGYSYTAQSVSELRAIGAPTRSLLLPILYIYSALEIAFGFGVWSAAGPKRSLGITGGLLIVMGLLDAIALSFTLNLGEAVGSLANTLHTGVTVANMLTMLLILAFGATADGKWFRLYSYVTLVALVAFGVWTFMELPRIAANLPTPWMGVKERIGIYGYFLWLAVLASVLLRAPAPAATGKPPASIGAPQITPS